MSSTVPSPEPDIAVTEADAGEGLRGRDFLHVRDFSPDELRAVLDLAAEIKSGRYREQPLRDRHVAMLFQRPSHRTRVSFEVGIGRLGGRWTTLGEQDVQLGVRETVSDAARVLDRYVALIVARLQTHAALAELARGADVPVINALTEQSHPCQILADLLTIREHTGRLEGVRVAYVGDGNNICNSLMEAAALLEFDLAVVNPPGYHPADEAVRRAAALGRGGHRIAVTEDLEAVRGVQAVYTDVWASMGHESEREVRLRAFGEYQVDAELMATAAPDAVFLHCLPAHRGEEVADDVIDGPASVVFDQAGNRLPAQMALMALLIGAQ